MSRCPNRSPFREMNLRMTSLLRSKCSEYPPSIAKARTRDHSNLTFLCQTSDDCTTRMNGHLRKSEWLVAFTAVFFCATQSNAMDAREVFKQISPSVVLIKTYDEVSTPLKLGSGFFVDDGHKLVTNFHVVDGAARVEIVLSDKSSVETQELVSYSQEHDLAILQVAISGKPVALSTHKPDVGDHILAIG